MERLLTQNEVAAILAISPKSVRRLRKIGKLQAVIQPFYGDQYGDRKYFKKSEVERYLGEELIEVKEARGNV